MQKWTILIVGIGPTFPSVEQSNELVGALLEQGYNVKQAVFTGDSPGESANLLAERDEKIAAGKDITIKPRRGIIGSVALGIEEARKIEGAADDIRVAELKARLLEMQNANVDLAAKLEAATTASPLAASAVADHEAQPTEENTKPEAS